jgi:hypothetical protein
MTHEGIVDAYIRDYRDTARAEMNYFGRASSLPDAIRRATEKHSHHQDRIKLDVLERAARQLQSASTTIRAAPNFTKLHSAIERLIGGMCGIGKLCVYDIAHRIGAFRGLEPTLVYLHRGTRDGARVLGFKGKTLDPKQLPAAFSPLTPAEIEDCLCIYKNALAGGPFRTGILHRASGCNYTLKNRVRKC